MDLILIISIISLSDLPSNKYSDTYSKYVNQIFGDSSAIRQYFNNDDVYNSFISALGGEKKAASLGIRFGSDGNGYRYAELPKDYHKSIYSFGKAVKEAEDTRNPLNAFLNSAKTRFLVMVINLFELILMVKNIMLDYQQVIKNLILV